MVLLGCLSRYVNQKVSPLRDMIVIKLNIHGRVYWGAPKGLGLIGLAWAVSEGASL